MTTNPLERNEIMKLNKWHRDIIEHRPVECIIDAAFDLDEDSEGNALSQMTEEEAGNYVESAKSKWETAESLDIALLNTIEQYILWDIIDGSTRACCLIADSFMGKITIHEGCETEYKMICKAGRELAREFSKHHVAVDFPVV